MARVRFLLLRETSLSDVHKDFRIVLVTFPLVLTELHLAMLDKLFCLVTLVHTWLIPLPLTQKHLEQTARVLAGGV